MQDMIAQSSHPSHPQGLQVLLLEESRLDQKLVIDILKSQQHEVTVAMNEEDALACLHSQTFDLAVVDMQMSGFDGVAAVTLLRTFRRDGLRCLPVITISAANESGECPSQGTDGVNAFVTKPIQPVELLAVVSQVWRNALSGETHIPSTPTEELVSWQVAMATVQGDYELLVQLLEAFLTEGPQLMQRITEAVACDDLEQLHVAAHTLKSGFRYFGATRARQLALRLETLAYQGRTEGLANHTRRLNAMWPEIEHALRNTPPPEQLSLDA